MSRSADRPDRSDSNHADPKRVAAALKALDGIPTKVIARLDLSGYGQRALLQAARRGARATLTEERWETLMALSKPALAELALHLAAQAEGLTGPQPVAPCGDAGDRALLRLKREIAALEAQGLI